MSTYCHRIVEYLNKDNRWVRCGETVNCFHGFDQLYNKDYYGRGFPLNATVKKDDLRSDDGKLYAWGFSYINLDELSKWCEKEKQESFEYILSEIHHGMYKQIMDRLDALAHSGAGNETPAEPTRDGEPDMLTDFNYFKQVCEEATDIVRMLDNEFARAYALADQVASKEEAYWVPKENVRIVFYYE